jgi:hypothetical protein
VDSPRKYSRRRDHAAALLIVLAMVVLATGLAVAYFSRATSDRPIANSSFNQAKVDQLAQSAMDNIIGDLRYEIVHGSMSPAPTFGPSTDPGPFNLYVPTTCLGCTPTPSPGTVCSNSTPTILPVSPIRYPSPSPGTTPAIPNLIRRSVRLDPIPCPARVSRASAVNSTADVSANGRSVTLARWNSHYLIPKSNTGDAGSDPITTGFSDPNYWAPDWVFVKAYDLATDQGGVSVITSPNALVIGRYAYMIYDEGGLVDVNAAGYPSPTTILQYGRKGSLAFADLTGLGSYGLSTTAIDNIVGWRNYASAQPTGLFPNFSFSTNSTNTYYNFVLSDPNYIQLPSSSPLTYSPIFFLTTAWQAPQNNNQTDQAFTTRQSLLKLRSAVSGGGIGFVNALQYLGTFSREAMASAPQWSPTTPDSTNPNFQTLLATAPFTRNDGTTVYVGDYLVSNRFLLQRLNWLTYKGPSGPSVANPTGRNIPTSAPSLSGCIPVSTACAPDYDMWLLTRSNGITFGLTSDFLRQGTDANILNYFGLAWDTTNQRWNYVGHGGSTTPISSMATLNSIAGTREPDFFELLQAGILNGSIGDSVTSYPELPTIHQQSSNQQSTRMLHILTIGANLIAQSRVDSYPVRIAFSVDIGGGNYTTIEAIGAPRLPYINSLAACPVGVSATTGGMNWLLVPNLWDPFRDTWDLTEANTSNSGNGPSLTPGYLRPPVRITIGGSTGAPSVGGSGGSGSVSLGVTSTVTQSGRVASASAVGTAITIPFSPFPTTGGLATGNVTTTGNPTVVVGRDGFLQAMRLGSSDFSTAPSSFDPTTLGSSIPGWSTIARPQGDNVNAPRSDQYVVFRISSPSTLTLPSTGYPVLILNTGFQMTMDYQSPNGTWYSYSFLQGNNATNTWITANPNPLYIATNYSVYGTPSGNTAPTIVNSGTTTKTLWNNTQGGVAALAKAPMFAKADPRSIRYNTVIGWITLPSNTAGIIGSIWPSGASAPTMQPDANPASYSQTTGDNAAAASAGVTSNPYDQSNSDPVRPVMMNRPFRSVGEMGYAFRDQPFRTLSFSSTNSPDAGLLDLFTTVAYGPTPTPSPSPSITPSYPTPTVTPRGGVISLNSLQAPALAAMLASTIRREDTARQMSGGAPSPSPSPLTTTLANNVATSLVLSTSSAPVVNRAALANLIANETGLSPTVPKTQRESIARALGEVDQTRTWNLILDVIAQSGRYPPNATSLQNGFVVEGEQRYWVHVAIDRFTGQVIDKQIEVVNE